MMKAITTKTFNSFTVSIQINYFAYFVTKVSLVQSNLGEHILINNPYTGGQILVSPDVIVEVSLDRLLDIRSGKADCLVRVEYNYFRWLAGLDNFITKDERVNMNISEMWIYDQAGGLLRHLGYDNI